MFDPPTHTNKGPVKGPNKGPNKLFPVDLAQELMEGGDLRSRNAELDEYGLRRFGWYQR